MSGEFERIMQEQRREQRDLRQIQQPVPVSSSSSSSRLSRHALPSKTANTDYLFSPNLAVFVEDASKISIARSAKILNFFNR